MLVPPLAHTALATGALRHSVCGQGEGDHIVWARGCLHPLARAGAFSSGVWNYTLQSCFAAGVGHRLVASAGSPARTATAAALQPPRQRPDLAFIVGTLAKKSGLANLDR